MQARSMSRASGLLIAAGLCGFWLQALWDIRHPPVYVSPWGRLAPSAPLPAAARLPAFP